MVPIDFWSGDDRELRYPDLQVTKLSNPNFRDLFVTSFTVELNKEQFSVFLAQEMNQHYFLGLDLNERESRN